MITQKELEKIAKDNDLDGIVILCFSDKLGGAFECASYGKTEQYHEDMRDIDYQIFDKLQTGDIETPLPNL